MIDYLIIARTGRALAASAKRAGYKVSVADYFADEDTQLYSESTHPLQYHCDGFDEKSLLNLIEDILSSNPNTKLVVGSGFESNPELLDSVAKLIPVLGNSKETIVALKYPESFFKILDNNSIRHPDVLFSKPTDFKRYLIKKVGGIGGGHVNWSGQIDSNSKSGCYFQEYVSGVVSSVVFLANGKQTKIVGFNQQLQSKDFIDMPFLYLGAMSTNDVSDEHTQCIQKIINKITKETNLKGLCGLDYIVNESAEIVVLEVNPRPPATFELHETEQDFLFDAHLACFNGVLIDYKNTRGKDDKLKGCAIFYTNNEIKISDKIGWPLWVKDRPLSGSVIPVKFPVCTVHAEENSLDKLKLLLSNRLKEIKSIIVAMQNAA